MFTINIYLRFALIAIGIIGGIVLWSMYGFWYGFPFLLMGIILLVGYVLMGTVQSAAMFMQNMEVDKVEQRLALTFFPKFLFKTNRAYMHMIRGTIGMYTKDYNKAEINLLKAQEIGLATESENGTVFFQLANLAANKGNWPGAQNYFRKAKEYKITDPEVKEQFKQFEKAMQSRSMISPANRGMMMQAGGKRKRPRG